ncbi:hypothetical protein BC829DRAFT_255312 [Chytridium lagenaria]|nr:hypothetical protein BC829DRAFT_255312 [Chytridium lagenaria]
MLEFMKGNRPYVLGYDHETQPQADTKLFFSNAIYHDEMAGDIREILFTSPVLKYGLIIGAPGCGKSRLLRSLASEQPYFGFLSMGLVGGVKSLVDALAEEVGYADLGF